MMKKSLPEKISRFAVAGAMLAKGKSNSLFGCSQNTAKNAEYQKSLWRQ